MPESSSEHWSTYGCYPYTYDKRSHERLRGFKGHRAQWHASFHRRVVHDILAGTLTREVDWIVYPDILWDLLFDECFTDTHRFNERMSTVELTPAYSLVCCTLIQAIKDVARNDMCKRERLEFSEWLVSDSLAPFSLRHICECIGLDYDDVQLLLSDRGRCERAWESGRNMHWTETGGKSDH